MRLPSLICFLATSLLSGCGSPTSPPIQQQELAQQAPVAKWSPDLLGGGGQMFGSLNDFVAYVNGASVIGTGVLTRWDGREGMVRAERIYHGRVAAGDVPVKSTGGFVEPKPGDEVLFVLSERDRELKLHSFCAASGLYPASQQLQSVIQSSLTAVK